MPIWPGKSWERGVYALYIKPRLQHRGLFLILNGQGSSTKGSSTQGFITWIDHILINEFYSFLIINIHDV